MKDLTAVIPKDINLFAVGGVNQQNISDWLKAGAKGVGLGSNIYSAGDTPEEATHKARVMIDAYHAKY